MRTRRRRLSREEIARRGVELYDGQIRRMVDEGNRGKVVGIDVESGAFEVGRDALTALHRLVARQPEPQIWFVRIGHRTLHRLGPRQFSEAS